MSHLINLARLLHGFFSYSHCSFVLLNIRTYLHTKMLDPLLHSWRHLFMSYLIDKEVSHHYLLTYLMAFLPSTLYPVPLKL